jgi:biopolymer transport protein ExbD
MTPLVDCTFLLILFFLLTSQMASESLARLEIARPRGSQAVQARMAARGVVINVLSAQDAPGGTAADGRAIAYLVDGRRIPAGDIEALTQLLRARASAEGTGRNLLVEVRADRRVHYGHVEPVLSAAAKAGVPRMNITAVAEPAR